MTHRPDCDLDEDCTCDQELHVEGLGMHSFQLSVDWARHELQLDEHTRIELAALCQLVRADRTSVTFYRGPSGVWRLLDTE